MRSGPASPWKNRWTSLTSAPGCGKGASARLRPVARPPMKLTPVSTPPRAPGSSNLDAFATATPLLFLRRQVGQEDDRGAGKLLPDPVAQVRDAGTLDHRDGSLELHRGGAEVGEQRRPPAQHDRHQLDAGLVEQAGLQALAGHLPAVDRDVLVPGQLLGLRHRRLDAVGDEDEVLVVLRTVVAI